MKSIITTIALALACTSWASAQNLEVLGSAGTESSSSAGAVAYTVGELVVSTESGTNGTVSQGYHQVFITATAIEELADIEMKVFPNPTSDYLIIESESLSEFQTVQIYDLNGQLVWQLNDNEQVENRIEVNFSNFAIGSYLLRFDNRVTYNVIKSH